MSTPRKVESTPNRQRSLVAKSSSVPGSLQPQALTLPFATGDVIAEKYEVVGILGVGGVAYVVSALHLELGEMVALKFLRPESLEHEEVVARFASEARAVARIKSEHVAHVYDVGSLAGAGPYIVMEYLEGKDLADVLAERGSLPVKVAVDYVLQACEALACAHVAGIVHRDIKPENLFLTQAAGSAEVVKVLDFGISKSALSVVETGDRRAHTMLPMGTPGYMSPEQIRACGSVDARTDIWALGCVLSELLTNRSTFEAQTVMQLSAAILERNPVSLREVLPDAPPELEALISKCLEKDPAERFQDVAELAAALYPFGPRRARISVERCRQVLTGKLGVAVEFHSVAPPPLTAASTPLPMSSTSPVVNAVEVSSAAADPLRMSTPATMSVSEVVWRPRRRGTVIAVLVGISAAAGVALAVWNGSDAGPSPRAVALGTSEAPSVNARPISAPEVTPPTSSAASDATAGPSVLGVAPEASSVVAPRSKRARTWRPAAAPAVRHAPPAVQARPAAKRPASADDSEPDVGY